MLYQLSYTAAGMSGTNSEQLNQKTEIEIITKNSLLIKEGESAGPDIHQNAYRDEVRKQRSAAITHKRQRDAYDRHNAQCHTDIYKKIDAEHEGDPECKH